MVLRFLISKLINNEQLIQKISESYPMRKAAQFAVKSLNSGKNLIAEQGLDKLSPQEFRNIMNQLSRNFKSQVKEVSDELKTKFKK